MPMASDDDLKGALAHVLWIGGATGAGTTSVAQAMAEKHGLQAYHYDRYRPRTVPGAP